MLLCDIAGCSSDMRGCLLDHRDLAATISKVYLVSYQSHEKHMSIIL